MNVFTALSLVVFLQLPHVYPKEDATVVIGSKSFPESRLLGEIFAVMLEREDNITVLRKFGLGGTKICFEALRHGEIDLYPEYTGTALNVLLNDRKAFANPDLLYTYVGERLLADHRMTLGPSLGFNNTYALAVRSDFPLSDLGGLVRVPDTLQIGCSHEFLNRPDGYHALARFYGFDFTEVAGMEHGLTYPAIVSGNIDITDAYTTDGRIEAYGLKLLEDDRGFFPPYQAAAIVRTPLYERNASVRKVLAQLENKLSDETMRQLNYLVEVQGDDIRAVASGFLVEAGLLEAIPESRSFVQHRIVRKTLEHLWLTFAATLLAILVGVPAGFLITRNKKVAGVVLSVTSVLQTIPSLALLGFMIPLFGIGIQPAIAALFLYALLPIIRNTYAGILSVDTTLTEAGKSMGMTKNQRLIHLELPLSVRTIMAGVRTATVINIGTATLAAFIGAGGLGELIITGISLNNNMMILEGALPAAALAILLDLALMKVEKKLTPPGVQENTNNNT